MNCYIDTPMAKFSDRPDRTVSHRAVPCVYREKISEPDRYDPTLDNYRRPDFGRADRRDRA
ncbi:MAG: hypothetical protein GX424_07020 [Clostridiales bacterium]|jgi:hypothetical protein|nr:hypothetical protein [Clostridiales bacterium]